jgi:hypothetical protein
VSEELLKSLDEKILDEKFEKLQKNIENYCGGDYGTLESRLEDTLWIILDILKDLRKGDKE